MNGEVDTLIVEGDGNICPDPVGCDDGNVVGSGSIVSSTSMM